MALTEPHRGSLARTCWLGAPTWLLKLLPPALHSSSLEAALEALLEKATTLTGRDKKKAKKARRKRAATCEAGQWVVGGGRACELDLAVKDATALLLEGSAGAAAIPSLHERGMVASCKPQLSPNTPAMLLTHSRSPCQPLPQSGTPTWGMRTAMTRTTLRMRARRPCLRTFLGRAQVGECCAQAVRRSGDAALVVCGSHAAFVCFCAGTCSERQLLRVKREGRKRPHSIMCPSTVCRRRAAGGRPGHGRRRPATAARHI